MNADQLKSGHLGMTINDSNHWLFMYGGERGHLPFKLKNIQSKKAYKVESDENYR